MKHSILGSLVGIAIVIALDSITRVILSTYTGQEILMFSYSSFEGLLWPVMLTILAGLTSFLGALFSINYGKSHKVITALLFLLLLVVLRYGQIHLLMSTESLFYPITALVLSIGGTFIAWQIIKDKVSSRPAPVEETRHHYPTETQE